MAEDREKVLRRAVRLRVVLRTGGDLLLVLGAATCLPILAALLLGEAHRALPYALVAALLGGLGWACRRIQAPASIQPNEALVVIALAFLVAPLAMAAPLVAQGIPVGDALFEAISGVTTTGLSTLASVEDKGRTFWVARAWAQWIGGLGFVVFSLALVLEPGLTARRLGVPVGAESDLLGSMRGHARRTLGVYLGISLAGVVLLLLLGAGFLDAVVHTLAAVSTGGFAPRDDSLASFGTPALRSAVLVLCLLGAISFPLQRRFALGDIRASWRDPELRLLLALIAFAALCMAWPLSEPGGLGASLALAVSAQTTAGFSTSDPAALGATTKALVVFAMLSGGSHGSTAGGIKLLRLLVALRLVHWSIVRTRLPAHASLEPRLAGERVEARDVERALVVISLFVLVAFLSWLPFLAFGYDPLDSLFEVVSALGTVGLSTGITRPELEPTLKGVLCLDMLLGRLEILALLSVLAPGSWWGTRSD